MRPRASRLAMLAAALTAAIALAAPIAARGDVTATSLAAGRRDACALEGASGLICWGHDIPDYKGCIPEDDPGCVPVPDEEQPKPNNKGWGYSAHDPGWPDLTINVPASIDGAVAIGWSRACGLRSGAVVCWGVDGWNAQPPASVNGTSGTATAIAAGNNFECAIQAGTGAVKCWDDNQYGAATPPASVDGTSGSASAISLGATHGCAIQAGTGRVVCWGDERDGQSTPQSTPPYRP